MVADKPPAEGTTDVHRGPRPPSAAARRAALLCAFPRPLAFALPDSGTSLGRGWLGERGIEDSEISIAHVRFDRAGGVLRVADAGSRNGTWVDGAPLAPDSWVTLEDGAVLRLGRTLLVVCRELAGPLEPAPPLGELVGPFGLRALGASVEGLARARPSNVLLEGETGTGKELAAHAIARALGRHEPFGPVNVAGVAPGVFEAQLFGHVQGSFSGAFASAPGIVAAHDGGTVFLDEIGELPLELQAKLLRLLDNREVLPVGAQRPVRADVLVLAATNRPLAQMVAAGTFRSDLYARLSMARIELPPLRQRPGDLFAIAQALAARHGQELRAEDVEVEAVERLLLEDWPRNVRELAATLEAVHRLDPALGLRLWALDEVLGGPAEPKATLSDELVDATVQACDGNVSEAAKRLGVSRGRLLRFRKRARRG